jgi:hypothetical protein
MGSSVVKELTGSSEGRRLSHTERNWYPHEEDKRANQPVRATGLEPSTHRLQMGSVTAGQLDRYMKGYGAHQASDVEGRQGDKHLHRREILHGNKKNSYKHGRVTCRDSIVGLLVPKTFIILLVYSKTTLDAPITSYSKAHHQIANGDSLSIGE